MTGASITPAQLLLLLGELPVERIRTLMSDAAGWPDSAVILQLLDTVRSVREATDGKGYPADSQDALDHLSATPILLADETGQLGALLNRTEGVVREVLTMWALGSSEGEPVDRFMLALCDDEA